MYQTVYEHDPGHSQGREQLGWREPNGKETNQPDERGVDHKDRFSSQRAFGCKWMARGDRNHSINAGLEGIHVAEYIDPVFLKLMNDVGNEQDERKEARVSAQVMISCEVKSYKQKKRGHECAQLHPMLV